MAGPWFLLAQNYIFSLLKVSSSKPSMLSCSRSMVGSLPLGRGALLPCCGPCHNERLLANSTDVPDSVQRSCCSSELLICIVDPSRRKRPSVRRLPRLPSSLRTSSDATTPFRMESSMMQVPWLAAVPVLAAPPLSQRLLDAAAVVLKP